MLKEMTTKKILLCISVMVLVSIILTAFLFVSYRFYKGSLCEQKQTPVYVVIPTPSPTATPSAAPTFIRKAFQTITPSPTKSLPPTSVTKGKTPSPTTR